MRIIPLILRRIVSQKTICTSLVFCSPERHKFSYTEKSSKNRKSNPFVALPQTKELKIFRNLQPYHPIVNFLSILIPSFIADTFAILIYFSLEKKCFLMFYKNQNFFFSTASTKHIVVPIFFREFMNYSGPEVLCNIVKPEVLIF